MIRAEGPWFRDEHGRALILRGVNLGGSSKAPFGPKGPSHVREGFFDHRSVSFVGRPFPLAEADEHLRRLHAWGFRFLRFLITWEAVEHAGPGQYDYAYIDYVAEVVRRAGEHGINVFIDPHQDAWSRFTGGDGAPGWTLEAVGMQPEKLVETGAAVVHNQHPGQFPRMIWPTNYAKLGAATMFTLFFAGSDFAPNLCINGQSVQEYLQAHYIEAVRQVALAVKNLPNVAGFDTLNEPTTGYIGRSDLTQPFGVLLKGYSPSPLQSWALGEGIPQEVEVWDTGLTGPKLQRRETLNEAGARLWREGCRDVWRAHGVWDVDSQGKPYLIEPDYFSRAAGRKVVFGDYIKPFAIRYTEAIRSINPDWIIFFENAVDDETPPRWSEEDPTNIAYAPHWYDGMTLFTKSFNPWLGVDTTGEKTKLVVGPGKVRKSFADQLGQIKRMAQTRLGGVPTLLGEFGIPFDLNGKRAYRSGNFSKQAQALDASFCALEANLLSGTLWNYTADNTNAHGDQWNEEDLSIFSRDQQTDPEDINSGGRALEAGVRPYAVATAGEPLAMSFDRKRKLFVFEFRHDPAIREPSEFYVPNLQYPRGYRVILSDGEYWVDRENQRMVYRHTFTREVHRVEIVE